VARTSLAETPLPRSLETDMTETVSTFIQYTITKTRFGYHVGTTDDIFFLEQGMFAWTLKGAHRKAERQTRRILRAREARVHAVHTSYSSGDTPVTKLQPPRSGVKKRGTGK
jgi:hypothetical protein